MEFVRHHVESSGNGTLRGFFASDNVDYDPPSSSLRQNIKKAKCQYVYSLADGATGDDDEMAIRDALKSSENSYELIRMVYAMGGWAGMDDELEEAYLDPVAAQIAQVLDQRDYVPWQMIRRYLFILDYDASFNLGDAFLKVLQWPLEFQGAEFDAILDQKAALLGTIASACLRRRDSMQNAAMIDVTVIQRYAATVTFRVDELVRLMHEVRYTVRICASLARLQYKDLYSVLLDMADPAIVDVRQRQACHDRVAGLNLEFSAAEDAVKSAGSSESKATIDRFMIARNAALATFAPAVPPATVLTAIAQAIGSVAATLADLQTAISNLPDLLTGSLTLASLTGDDADDSARNMVNSADAQGWLSRVPYDYKLQAIVACLTGWTVDADEIAINKVLGASKDHDQAELYQLASAATWDALYTSLDGDEYDQMLSVLSQPV